MPMDLGNCPLAPANGTILAAMPNVLAMRLALTGELDFGILPALPHGLPAEFCNFELPEIRRLATRSTPL